MLSGESATKGLIRKALRRRERKELRLTRDPSGELHPSHMTQGLGKVGSWGPDLRVCGGAGVTDVACVAAGRAWDPR